MKITILVIEDEEAINDVISMSLRATGYETVSFLDGDDASVSLENRHDYDCAVVDVMLPGKDGFELLPELLKYEIPVIFLTAKGELQNKVKGLTKGAEDDVVIDREKRVVTKGGQEVYLKPMEFDCLMMLVRNKNRALTRSQLLGALWGIEFEGETRTVDAHIGRIRKKLGFENVIKTIPRIGYRLEVEE